MLIATGLAACSVRSTAPVESDSATSLSNSSATSVAARTTSTALPTTTTTRGPRGSGESVVIAFGGDVHFRGELLRRLHADPATVLLEIAPIFTEADLAMVNLETTITEGGTPAEKTYTFRAPATALDALRAAGIDVASTANNHGVDYGPEGLSDTLGAAYVSEFPLIGIGNNATEAYEPFRITINGQRIAIIAATQVIDPPLVSSWTARSDQPGLASAYEIDQLVNAVQAARADSDTVVVYLHWGKEHETCPTSRQRDTARTLAEAGADIIVGSHTHRLLGAGLLGTPGGDSVFVSYGLGNMAFNVPPGPTAESGVLLVTVTGREIDNYEFRPARLFNGVPRPLDGEPAATALADWNARRDCTDLTA